MLFIPTALGNCLMFAISVLGLVRGKVYVRDTPKEGPLQLKPQANLMQLSSRKRWRVR